MSYDLNPGTPFVDHPLAEPDGKPEDRANGWPPGWAVPQGAYHLREAAWVTYDERRADEAQKAEQARVTAIAAKLAEKPEPEPEPANPEAA